MKRSLGIIKFVLLGVLIVFLFSFSSERNKARKLINIDLEFIDENSPFITLNMVNKLLIQNQDKVTSIDKETLDLNEMEHRLKENPMIRDAQVFMTADGVLGAKIEQRTPIGRVSGSPDYYVDTDGKKMPLSSVYTARVPIINASPKLDFEKVTRLLFKINEDPFMKNGVIGLDINGNEEVVIRFRKHDFKVLFGTVESIEKKFQNFKAFYRKTKQDDTLKEYQLVNLQYESQVVATKR